MRNVPRCATVALLTMFGMLAHASAVAEDRLLDVAEAAGLTILVDAVEAAGLTDTLNSDGPFTVFAPTNEAFLTLLDELDLTPEELFANTELLTTVLTYHVVGGALDADAVLAQTPLGTVQGDSLQAAVQGDAVVINGNSTVALPNVTAANGIAHVIDRVLLPPTVTGPTLSFSLRDTRTAPAPLDGAALRADDDNFVFIAPTDAGSQIFFAAFWLNGRFVNFDSRAPFDAFDRRGMALPLPIDRLEPGINTIQAVLYTFGGQVHLSGSFTVLADDEPKLLEVAEDAGLTILVDAVEAAGLTDTLNSDGPFTVFAPTNEAFLALLEDLELSADELFADTELLQDVLLYHVIADELDADAVVSQAPLMTVQGDDITVALDGETVVLNGDTEVLLPNVGAANGIAHVIDKVLLPPQPEPLALSFSLDADRSDAEALDGAVIESGSDVFGFLTPINTEDVFASLFFVNGRFAGVDVDAPFDVSSRDGEATPIRNLQVGANDVIAVAFTNQGIQFVYAHFEIVDGAAKLLDVAEAAGLTILVDAVEAAGLTDTLNAAGPFTVFAPTNEAFLALLDELDMTPEELFADTELLTNVLLYHVVPGAFDGAGVLANAPLTTVQGAPITAELVGETVVLNGSIEVILPNVGASNGITHVINEVLQLPMPRMTGDRPQARLP